MMKNMSKADGEGKEEEEMEGKVGTKEERMMGIQKLPEELTILFLILPNFISHSILFPFQLNFLALNSVKWALLIIFLFC